jgi:hypothetical protein
MRLLPIVASSALLAIVPSAAQARFAGPRASTARVHVRAGGYAQKASEVDKKEGQFEYSNGAVDLRVARGGKVITLAGVACNIGPEPREGLEGYDEVTIHVPKHMTISSSGAFSFSGPVTLTPEDTQSEESLTTTYTIKGRFQDGRIAVTGTDSPLCRPGTVTRFRLKYDPSA